MLTAATIRETGYRERRQLQPSELLPLKISISSDEQSIKIADLKANIFRKSLRGTCLTTSAESKKE